MAPKTPRDGSPWGAWLAAHGLVPLHVEPLAGDLSPRRYHRLHLAGGGTAILAVYPADAADACHRFLRTSALLAAAGVRVPAILAAGCERGWTVVEDLGTATLFDEPARGWDALAPWYDGAAAALAAIAGLDAAEVAGLSPPLDAALLRRELAQTEEVFLVPRGYTGAQDAEAAAALDALCANLAGGGLVPCHRDFMARNLVALPGGVVGVLDHQDLRLGPHGYDLASLLNDSLFAPEWLERRLLAAVPALLDRPADYHRAAAQRTLKAVGTFVRFALRGSDRHLPLVRPTFSRSLRHLARVPETAALARRWAAKGRGLAEAFC